MNSGREVRALGLQFSGAGFYSFTLLRACALHIAKWCASCQLGVSNNVSNHSFVQELVYSLALKSPIGRSGRSSTHRHTYMEPRQGKIIILKLHHTRLLYAHRESIHSGTYSPSFGLL